MAWPAGFDRLHQRLSLPERSQRLLMAGLLCSFPLLSALWGSPQLWLSWPGLAIAANHILLVVLLCGPFFPRERLLGFVHTLALWLILVMPQASMLSGGMLHQGQFFYGFYDDRELVLANSVLACWAGGFTLAYLGAERLVRDRVRPGREVDTRTLWRGGVLALVALGLLFMLLENAPFTRAAFEGGLGDASRVKIYGLIFPLRLFPLIVLAAAALVLMRGWTQRLSPRLMATLGVLAAAVLVLNNPLAAPRYFFGMVVVAFAYIAWMRRQATNLGFLLVALLGVILFVPLDFGREATSLGQAAAQIRWSPRRLLLGDIFSTFETLPAAVRFVALHGDAAWRQLFGNLLFFVPRAVWPTKPIGTGNFMVETDYGSARFGNVSCALPCEGYINRGLVGVLLLAVVLGVALGAWDCLERNRSGQGGENPARTVLYAFLVGHLTFATRGDLLQAVAVFAAVTLAWSLLWLLSRHPSQQPAPGTPPEAPMAETTR